MGRGDTTVAVFNGTTINGLAVEALPTSSQSQGLQARVDGRLHGPAARDVHDLLPWRNARRQARDISRALNISDLRAMDAETQALAGERASVAVVVGSDKAP